MSYDARKPEGILYRFTFCETGKRAHLGAYHGEELSFLSDSFPSDWAHDDDDKVLGKVMRAYWTQFARTGNPNTLGRHGWPQYDAHTDQCLELGRVIRIRPVAPRLQIIEHIMKQVFAATTTMRLSSEAKTSGRQALAGNSLPAGENSPSHELRALSQQRFAD